MSSRRIENIDTSNIGGRVRLIRTMLNMIQKEFGDKIGMSVQAISDIEKGNSKPGFNFIQGVSKYFNVNLEFLIHGDGDVFKGIQVKRMNHYASAKEIEHFVRYFYNSRIVQFNTLKEFQALMFREGKVIEYEYQNAMAEAKKKKK